ncbi:hypothetical protein FXO38_20694 [Capsicum annuum]|nr:hypothetical protein FXO37_32510 [Capsicum annuum]KAF3643289.1 hypothetical protein FXO38_20694 [Capsicum annuum]
MRFLPGEAALGDRSDSGKCSKPWRRDSSSNKDYRPRPKTKIRTIDHAHELFIVGRGKVTILPLTAGLTDWSECPELGAIGDLLASSDQASVVSVLVVQQYVGMGQGNHFLTPDSPGQQLHDHFNFSYHRTQIHALEAFIVIYLFL